MTVAIVLQGDRGYMGTDEMMIEEPPFSTRPGVLRALREQLALAPLVRSAPDASALLVTYGLSADLRRPLGPLSALSAEVLGNQRDYVGDDHANLGDGVALGLDELRVSPPDRRRMLIVIGDGFDGSRDREESRRRLQELRARAAVDHIEVCAIVYKGFESEPATDITALDDGAVTVRSVAEIVHEIHRRLASPTPVVAPTPTCPPPVLPSDANDLPWLERHAELVWGAASAVLGLLIWGRIRRIRS